MQFSNEVPSRVNVLPTAMVILELNGVHTKPIRAILDTGSQPNLITSIVLRKYGFRAKTIKKKILGVSCEPINISRKIELKVFPWFDLSKSIDVDFWVLPKEAKWNPFLPDRLISPGEIDFEQELMLADPMFWKPGEIQLLLGIEICAQILKPSICKMSAKLMLQDTILGAMILGSTGNGEMKSSNSFQSVQCEDTTELERLVKRFWEIEEIPVTIKKSKEHLLVEQIFKEGHTRDENGRFSVPIPIDPNCIEIGNSRNMALRRFYSLENRFAREPEFKRAYVEFMKEYEELGHMSKVEHKLSSDKMHYYIPHHGIISSGKFRVVFDCSCKTDKGISLNDVQLLGPKLQRDLFEIVLRSRRHKVALSVDIKKMFRQIRIIQEQRDLQRIFWRENSHEPLREYCLDTVIFGQKSSPSNAIMVILKGARAMSEQFPRTAKIIQNDLYMDDCFTGADSEEEVKQIAEELEIIFASMGFELDKYKSDSPELTEYLKGDQDPIIFDESVQQSILGLKWDLKEKVFTYRVKDSEVYPKWTRRTVLSKCASLFDPLGHLSPLLLLIKAFVQKLWTKTKTWDEPLSKELELEWLETWSQIRCIEQVKIPRWLGVSKGVEIELYGFCDASLKGYGAVLYSRVVQTNGEINVVQLAAKSRVAPLKILSIPKLELLGATLLAELAFSVRNSLEWENIKYFLFTDSKTVWQWILKEPDELKTFESHRVQTIRDKSSIDAWAHVRTKENPADLISRGLSPLEIVDSAFWWKGPEWLSQPKELWPEQLSLEEVKPEPEMLERLRVHTISCKKELTIPMTDGEPIPLLQFSNDLNKIQLIYCYILRFCKGLRAKPNFRVEKSKRKHVKIILLPSNEEKGEALKLIIKREQERVYAKELKGNAKGSEIESLRPTKDEQGILRVGGRLKHAACPYEMRAPLIIPPKSRLSKLLITDAHERTHHGHVQVMMQFLRNRYWIPRLRQELRVFVQNCVRCVRFEHPLGTQLMASLPYDRVNPFKAFLHTGVDYAGPIEIKETLKTRTNKRKCWIALFVCLTTRAIHLDLVTDLTSASFIQCFKRFVGRRGACAKLYSDNATTFVGSNKELKEALQKWHTKKSEKALNYFGTSWRFMTAGAPHQGGIYEAGVKSTKHHLRRVIGNQCWTYEQYLTFLIEVEAVLNSRPLYPLSDDPNDLQALTPGHFLVGEPLKVPQLINPPPRTTCSLKRIWAEAQSMKEHFWERWSAEYLPTLQQRNKWKSKNENYKIGQLVIIKDENLPPAQWLLGRIIELFRGDEDAVRSVKIKTENGTLSRPVQKICILPVEGAEQENNSEQEPNERDVLVNFLNLLSPAQRGSVSIASKF